MDPNATVPHFSASCTFQYTGNVTIEGKWFFNSTVESTVEISNSSVTYSSQQTTGGLKQVNVAENQLVTFAPWHGARCYDMIKAIVTTGGCGFVCTRMLSNM